MSRKAVFLDLQGTLGGDGLGDIRDFTFYPCTVPALRLFQQIGLLTIVVTNQSHIEKGLLTYRQYEERVQELQAELDTAGAGIDAIYCCPHRASPCTCKKPKLGMIHAAQQEFRIDLNASFVVGDMGSSDMMMARAAGCKCVLVLTGVGKSSLSEFRHTWAGVEADFIADDVLQAAEWIGRQIEEEAIFAKANEREENTSILEIERTQEMEKRLGEKARRRGQEAKAYVQRVVMDALSQEEDAAESSGERRFNVMEFHGVGREALKDLDVQKYLADLRDEWV